MLEVLRRIVQAVNGAADLDEALGIIVGRVKEAMGVDVASVYLRASASHDYVLKATDGLNPAAVGRVRLREDEGLVGLVGTRREPVNLEDAASHPHYRYFPETGEERYNSFLGVPIIHYRRLLGVLVVQQRSSRRFAEEEVDFLVTISAQLAGAIIHAARTGESAELAETVPPGTQFLEGVKGASGVALGTILVLRPTTDLAAVPDRPAVDPEAEVAAFHGALDTVGQELSAGSERLRGLVSDDAHLLFAAYRLVLDSETIAAEVERRIRDGLWAPAALRDTISSQARVFDTMDDDYLRARGDDVRNIGQLIMAQLLRQDTEVRDYPPNTVLVGDFIGITHVADVPMERLAGIACTRGSAMSHVAVLANSLGIPAVMGLGELPLERLAGREMVVDGYRGRVCIDPAPPIRNEYVRLLQEERELDRELVHLRALPAETRDGFRVTLQVNSGLLADIGPSQETGSEGVGLYRTEFPFMVRQSFPGEEEQVRIYRRVLAAFAPLPVTMRTLDVGGDKVLPYFPIEEENPFLGWRGIRFTLDHPEIFLTQIRAMLRADMGVGNLRLLLPMVSQLGELDEALELLRHAHEELQEDGYTPRLPEVGVMLEVPSLIYQMDGVLERVDFVSIGTNDLTQYLLAVDRNNARVANLYDGLHPSVLRAMTQVVADCHRHRKSVSVCGEMAGDPAGAYLLVAMGVDGLSMSASSLPRIKWLIRTIRRTDARALLARVLDMVEPLAIRTRLYQELDRQGLGSLVRAGR